MQTIELSVWQQSHEISCGSAFYDYKICKVREGSGYA